MCAIPTTHTRSFFASCHVSSNAASSLASIMRRFSRSIPTSDTSEQLSLLKVKWRVASCFLSPAKRLRCRTPLHTLIHLRGVSCDRDAHSPTCLGNCFKPIHFPSRLHPLTVRPQPADSGDRQPRCPITSSPPFAPSHHRFHQNINDELHDVMNSV